MTRSTASGKQPTRSNTGTRFDDFRWELLEDPPAIFLALGSRRRAVSKRFQVVAPPGGTSSDHRRLEARKSGKARRIETHHVALRRCSWRPQASCRCWCTEQSRSIRSAMRPGDRLSTGNVNVASRAAEQIGLYVQTNVDILQSVAGNLEGHEPRAVAAGPHPEECRARLSGVPRDHALRRGRQPTRIQPRRPVEAPVPAVRHELRPEHHAVADRHRRRPPADRVVGIKLTQLGQSSGSLVGEISLEEMWRMVDRIRVGEQGFALVVAPTAS